MCDTVVALPDATADGVVLFGKNSDRHPNEAQLVERHPRREREGEVECTYVSVPAAGETNAVLLSRPTWLWGAEMGVNEHDVVIGNEAVFTKEPYDDTGLLGMDLVRLGLERADTATAALEVITDLLEAHGQGGNCSPFGDFTYHNSFLIADREGAWILETAGEHWGAKRVEEGIAAISNGLTIVEPDRESADLRSHAVEEGWCDGSDSFDFAPCYRDRIYTRASRCRRRRGRVLELLEDRRGSITERDLMATLRDHGGGETPARAYGSVCMHAGVVGDQTTGSQVSRLAEGVSTHWFTGTSAPCTSVFTPYYVDVPTPDLGDPETGTCDDESLWWRHERLHRAILSDFGGRHGIVGDARETLEGTFREEAAAVDADPDARRQLVESCFERADAARESWLEAVEETSARAWTRPLYAARWHLYDRQVGYN